MKKGLLLMFLVCAVGMTYGQSQTQLSGPKAKNYKPWKAEKSAVDATVSSLNVERNRGPKAKNAGIWRYKRRVGETSKLATTFRARLQAAGDVPFTGWIRSSSKYYVIDL